MKYLCSFVVVSLSCLCVSVAGFARSTPKSAFARTSGPSVSFTRLVEPLVQHSAATIFTEFSNPHHISEIAKKAGKKYVVLSEERPFITKGVSAAIVGGIGDIFSQTLFACATGLPFRWDALRTATFMMMGLCFKGPALHIWYNILGRVSHWTKVRKGFSETNQSLSALTLDQTVGVAIFYPLYFIVFELFSSTLSFRLPNLLALQAKMAATLIPVVLAQYCVWPLAQFLSFKYCPPALRVLYADAISVFWNRTLGCLTL